MNESYWQKTSQHPCFKQLNKDIKTDILIIGGGLSGISCAYQLIVTQDMSERKAKMIELGDAFIAFPGGTGTLEEITEVMSKVSLKHLKTPCMLYNLNEYYDDLKKLLNKMIAFDYHLRKNKKVFILWKI